MGRVGWASLNTSTCLYLTDWWPLGRCNSQYPHGFTYRLVHPTIWKLIPDTDILLYRFHVVPRMSASKDNVTQEDVERVIEEKRTVLDLLEAFAFALKHHLREEPGPYYEDLYPLLLALENSPYHQHRDPLEPTFSPVADVSRLPAVPGNTYGTFESNIESGGAASSSTAPLLPGQTPKQARRAYTLIPFYAWITGAKQVVNGAREGGNVPNLVQDEISQKHHPKLAGGGGNIPLECIRALAEWAGTIEDRGAYPETWLGIRS